LTGNWARAACGYLAHDLKHGRDVALEVLRPELAAILGPERFQREIRLAARLQHPHILSVHDSGETAGFSQPIVAPRLFDVLPFVDSTAAARARPGGLRVAAACGATRCRSTRLPR
jgi:serine/threonine-protein kinase